MADDQKPVDPISENQNILKGKPVKAFLHQDHQAHITVHQSAMQDPHVQQLVGMNPQMAQTLQASMTAHIMEHLGFEYRKQLEMQMGITLPPYHDPDNTEEDEQPIPAEMEAQISQMAAKASQQLLQQHQQQQQAAQNAQMQQDPIIQLQQQEMQLKKAELDRKVKKDQVDAQFEIAKLALEKDRIDSQQYQAGANLAVKTHLDKAKMDAQEKSQGFNSVMDLHKNQAQHNQNVQHKVLDHLGGLHNTYNDQEHELKLEEMRQRTQQRLAEQRKTQKPKE